MSSSQPRQRLGIDSRARRKSSLPVAGLMALAFSVAAVWTGWNPAQAHSWYTGKTNPVTKVSCCGGYDCAPVSKSLVKVTDSGWEYIPTGEVIDFDQTLPSEDGGFHRCEFLDGDQKGETRCFFAPGFGS